MVCGIARVKDEADIVEHVVKHMLDQVDLVLVDDNASSDGTYEILREIPGVICGVDDQVAYYQAERMTQMAARAREQGADWVVPFDADEIWFARDGRRIADVLEELPDDVLVAEADLYDHVATARDPQAETDPVARLGWRRDYPSPLPKVAVRVAGHDVEIHQGNHGATFPSSAHPLTVKNLLTIRHFPYRSIEQFARKARNGAEAYAATDLPEETGAHWRGFGRILETHGEQGIADVFHTWYWRERPDEALYVEGERQGPLVFDPCP